MTFAKASHIKRTTPTKSQMKLTHLPMSQSMTVNKDDVCIPLAETSCDLRYISNIRYILLQIRLFVCFTVVGLFLLKSLTMKTYKYIY